MARAITENFHEMVVEVETSGNPLPTPVAITSISNANPAVVTVSAEDIADFVESEDVTIVGVPAPMAAANGVHVIGAVLDNTFVLTGVDTSAAGAPVTATGMMATAESDDPLIWTKICGLTSRSVNRTTTMQQTEVPDCDDESLPSAIEKSAQSSEVTISGTGVWAAQSHEFVMEWWRSGATKNIRVGNLKALSGDIIYEQGSAFLTQLNNTAEKGQKVTSEINVEFDGMPTVTYAA